MRPAYHFAASFSAGAALWYFSKSFSAGLLCVLLGVIIDFDHVIEYVLHYGWEGLSIKKVYDACDNLSFSKLYILFHTWEVAILFWAAYFITKNIYILALSLGYSTHLVLDAIANPLHPHSYFMLWRAHKKFRTKDIRKKES